MLFVCLVVIFLVVLSINLYVTSKKRQGMPPGPIQLPIVGYLPFINKNTLAQTIQDMHKKYGQVFLMRLGVRDLIYINNYDIAKQVFSCPDFVGRPDYQTFLTNYHGKLRGITGATGKLWEEQRRFIVRHLRDFGFGKTSLEDSILTQVDEVVQDFKKNNGKPFSVSWSFNMSMVNILWNNIAGERLDDSDSNNMSMMKVIEQTSETAGGSILDFLPWLKPYISEKAAGTDIIGKKRTYLLPYFQKLVQRHEDSYDPNIMRDLIDVYLAKIYEDEANGIKDSTFTRPQLYGVLSDIIGAGSNTPSTVLRYCMLYLLQFPEIQEKIHKEIEQNVGFDHSISLKDKDSLPYLQAFIMEVQRFAKLAPFGAPHMAIRDTKIGEFNIPKGTIVNVNVMHIHKDPKYWKDPQQFIPERFLNESGSLVTSVKAFLPFSMGKRSCPGEGFSKMLLFLTMARILQTFKLSNPSDCEAPSAESRKNGGLMRHPKKFDIVATPVVPVGAA